MISPLMGGKPAPPQADETGWAGFGRAALLPVPVERVCGRLVARRQRQVGKRLPIRHRRVAPPPRLDILNAQEPLHAVESLGVHQTLQAVPGPLHPAYGVDASLVLAQQLFPQSAPRAQALVPAHMVEPQEQRLGHRVAARESVPHRREVLAYGVAAAGGAVEAETSGVRAIEVDPRLVGPAPR